MQFANKSRPFLIFSGAVLTITALAKIVSVFGSTEALMLPDPLFGWQTRWVMLMAGLTEIMVLSILLSKRGRHTKLAAITWLGSNFAAYRVCLWMMGAKTVCPCMGSVYGLFGMDSSAMDRVMTVTVAILLVGGSFLLYAQSNLRLAARHPDSPGRSGNRIC